MSDDTYPSMTEVEEADHEQLCRWVRFLPSPGWAATGRADFQEILAREKPVMDRIYQRFLAAGGMTPAISKSLGWDRGQPERSHR